MTGILTGESTAMLCAVSLSSGIALSALCDVIRIRRCAARMFSLGGTKLEAAVIFFEDTAFALLSAAVFSVIFYRFSWGAVRWYALFAALVGFAAYRMTLGRAVMACASAIIGFILRAVRFLIRIIRHIAAFVWGVILRFIVRPMCRAVKRLSDFALYPYYRRRSEALLGRVCLMAENGFDVCRRESIFTKWIKAKKEKKTKSPPTHSG